MSRRNGDSNKYDFVRVCAFVGILISAILYSVGAILSFLDITHSAVGILNLIASVAMLLSVAIAAWDFVKYKSIGWRIVYWVALGIYVFGIIFGVLPTFGIVKK